MVNTSKKFSLVLAASLLTVGGSFLAVSHAHAAIESNIVVNDIKWDNTEAPSAPINIAARAGNNQVVLTWNPVKDASSYEVRRYNVMNNTYNSVSSNTYTVLTTGVTDAVYTDMSAINGNMYGYVVNAVMVDGHTSQMSTPVVATPSSNSGHIKQALVLQSRATGAISGAISSTINMMNTSAKDINLSDIRVRYYFTGGTGLTAKNVSFNNMPISSNNVEPHIVNMEQTQAGADSYLELIFNAEAGIIPAGGESGNMSFTVQRTTGNAVNDYSYNDNMSMTDNNKIVVYYQGGPVWGNDPGVSEK